jgi:hypothetical protein
MPTFRTKITFSDTEENGDTAQHDKWYEVPVPSDSHFTGRTIRKRVRQRVDLDSEQ